MQTNLEIPMKRCTLLKGYNIDLLLKGKGSKYVIGVIIHTHAE